MNQFAAYQPVIVNNEKLEHHGQAGAVIAPGEKETEVKLDASGDTLVFQNTDLKAL